MQKGGLLVLLGLIASLLVSVQSQCVQDKYEPDNTLSQAHADVFSEPSLTICTNLGEDWFGPYSLLIGQSVTVTINFDNSQGNLDLRLTGFSGATLGASESGVRPDETVTIVGSSSVTSFYAQVRLASDAGAAGNSYSYAVVYGPPPPCSDDGLEPNDRPGTATPGPSTAAACLDNPDYYGPVVLQLGESVDVRVSLIDLGDTIDLTVVSPDDLILAFGNKADGLTTVTYAPANAETIYLRVDFDTSRTGSSSSIYTIDWSIIAPSCADEDYLEPNSLVEIPSELPGAAVSLVVCIESPDFFGPIYLTRGTTLSVQIMLNDASAGTLVDMRLHSDSGLLTPTTRESSVSGVTITYLYTDANPTSIVLEIFVLVDPSTSGVSYNLFSSLVKSCTGVVCGPDQECVDGDCICTATGELANVDGTCPDACDGVECPDGELCSNGGCVCSPGFERNGDGVCVTPDSCLGVICPPLEFCNGGVCECTPGFVRNGDGSCVPPDPCTGVVCPAQEVCEAGACVCESGLPRNQDGTCGVDPCLSVTCPGGEVCVNGGCECSAGLVRNGDGACVEICEITVCGPNSYCDLGACICNDGYEQTSSGCQLPPKCRGVVCPTNAACMEEDGACYCNPGFDNGQGGSAVSTNGFCSPVPCFNFNCPQNAYCSENQCYCNDGFFNSENGGASVSQTGICQQDLCALVICPENSGCDNGNCNCFPGFVKNSLGDCILDPCASMTCPDPNASCYNGVCFCPDGYRQEGDSCVEIGPDACYPTDCASMGALCHEDTATCMCDQNFVMSGGRCVQKVAQVCDFVSCPSYSQCYDGYCMCNDGYREEMGQCVPANLGSCSNYRGFTDELTVSLMSDISLTEALVQFGRLSDDLTYVVENLPEWGANDCCTNDYSYPFDMTDIAESAWSLLVDPSCSLDRYNQASQQFNQDLKY